MTLSELSQAVIDLLARTDYTESKSHEHINRAIRRIQNAVQLPDMESTVVLTLDSNLSAGIPNDYRGTRHMFFDDGMIPCEKIDLNRVEKFENVKPPLTPRPYYRLGDRWYFPVASEGDDVVLVYYAAWPALVNDIDSNELTILAPEVIIYGAASYAATYFVDKRVTEFEERFQSELEELELQRWQEDVETSSSQTLDPFVDPIEYPGGY